MTSPTDLSTGTFKVLVDAARELRRATTRYAPFHSAHEGFAVLLEEVDELKVEVWKSPAKRNVPQMREEAIQVAAMALRFVVDCCDTRDKEETPK